MRSGHPGRQRKVQRLGGLGFLKRAGGGVFRVLSTAGPRRSSPTDTNKGFTAGTCYPCWYWLLIVHGKRLLFHHITTPAYAKYKDTLVFEGVGTPTTHPNPEPPNGCDVRKLTCSYRSSSDSRPMASNVRSGLSPSRSVRKPRLVFTVRSYVSISYFMGRYVPIYFIVYFSPNL